MPLAALQGLFVYDNKLFESIIFNLDIKNKKVYIPRLNYGVNI
jgi:hypothetical protein